MKISEKIIHYQQSLNSKLNLSLDEINKESILLYLEKSHALRKVLTPHEKIALVALVGEYVRIETSGRWALKEINNDYNPSYEPNIVKKNNKIVPIYSEIIAFLNNPDCDMNLLLGFLLYYPDEFRANMSEEVRKAFIIVD